MEKLLRIYVSVFFISVNVVTILVFKDLIKVLLDVDPNFLSTIAPVISALAAVSNVILVIYFFFKTKRLEERKIRLERTSYWYRNIILDKNITRVNNLFDDQMINGSNKTINIPKIIKAYEYNKSGVFANVNDVIRIMDINFADCLDNILINYEDEFHLKLDEIQGSSDENSKNVLCNELSNIIQKYKMIFMDKLYSYEQEDYIYK